ncbi:MAG: hypothetical protein AB1592_12850 [Pseudomonadota bacterium]
MSGIEDLDGLISQLPDERQLGAALGRRADDRALADDLGYLETLAGSTPNPQPSAQAQGAGQPQSIVITPKRPEDEGSTIGRVGKDIVRGAVEAPRQILGGMRDAVQSAIDLGDWVADNLERIAPLGGVQLFDEAGNFSPGYVPAGDARLAPEKTGGELPAVKEAESVTGGVVRSVAQFLTGFAGAGMAMGGTLAGAPVARAAVQGALADFTAFDAHQKRLSNLVEEVPALSNPVSRYLAADPADGEAEGRLKNAIEGLGLGVAAEGVLRGIRYVRDWRRAEAAASPDKAVAREAAKPQEAKPLDLLGDTKQPLLAPAKADPASAKVAAAGRLTDDLGVPGDVAARGVSGRAADAVAPPEPGSVFVNWARIDTSDDIKAVMDDMAQAFGDDIHAARRGVRSNAQTEIAADSVDAWNVLMRRREGEPLNAEQAVAARRLWETSAEKLLETARAATGEASPEALFQFRKMMAVHHAVQREVIAARTETARALQSWKIPAGGGAEQLRAIENALASSGGSEAAAELARRVVATARLPGGMAMVDDLVEKTVFSRGLDAVKEAWVNVLLSNPKTHVVNALSNTATLGLSMVERAAASSWSRHIGSGEIMPGEAAAYAYGSAQGMKEGLRLFAQGLRSGESAFGASTGKVADAGFDRAISAASMKLNPDDWLGKAVDGLGFVVNLPTRFLGAADDFFKSVGYRMEVQAQAFRTASREVQDGVIPADAFKARLADLSANPPEEIRMAALDSALYNTFTSKPGKVVAAIGAMDRRLAVGSPGEKLGSFGLRILMPFRNTPANIMRYVFERTPMAPLMARYREAVAQGGAAADLARTRMALGSMGLLAVMDFALDGHITGGGPRGDKHKGDREALMRSGWQPYSIKVGERYFSYARTDPIGMSIGLAADIAEIVNNAQLDTDVAEDTMELVAAASASFGNQVLDKNYMAGLSGFVDALHNPGKAAGWAERTFASVVPAGAYEARKQVDPYMRYTHDLVSAMKNRIPGLSGDLPIARDFWGRPRTFQSGMGQTYDALSPIASRAFDPAPIDKAALENGFNLSMPQWVIGDAKLRNQPAAYSRLLEVRGQLKPSEMGDTRLAKKYGDVPLLDLVNGIVTGGHPLSAKYQAASGGPDGGKDELISRIVKDYSAAARVVVVREFDDVAARAKKEKK